MTRDRLQKVCDPNISITDNIIVLRTNWLKRKDLDNAVLYMHSVTYDKLVTEITNYMGFRRDILRDKTKYGTVCGLPIDIDNKIRPFYLEIREEDNMFVDRDSICMGIDSPDAFRYAIEDLATGGFITKSKIVCTLPKKYILNQDACILFWNDGNKTIVKRSKDDMQDPVKGFLWAYFLKYSGLSRTKANKYLKEIDEAYQSVLNKED